MPRGHDPARRGFLAAGAGTLASLTLPEPAAESMGAPFEFAETPIAQLAARMAAGTLTAEALATAYLERVASIDRAGPALNSVIELNPQAMEIARERDRERRDGRVRGPLHGIAIMVKDNIATGDRMSTTAGCLGLDGVRVAADAPLVARLREAGAVILAKTNLSEWANFRSSNSVSGWSSRGGQTLNPYGAGRSPSGSSSGSAVAVAANLCAAAIGTETDGSITSPCACNNLAGLKPTLGLVSGEGIVPIAHSQDTAGPMARTVADCALLMEAIGARPLGFTAHLGMESLEGVRIGIGRQYFGVHEKADGVIEAALAALRRLGARLVEVEIPSFGKLDEPEFEVLLHEFRHDLRSFLRKHMPGGPFRSLADVIEYNARHADRMMPIFGQDLLVKAQSKGPLTSPAYLRALASARRRARAQGIDAVVKKHRVEAIAALTSPPAWLIDPVNGDQSRGGCTSMAAVAGYPHLTVPAGFVAGLPVGISFFGPAFSDARLLGIGHAFEAATRHRRAPKLP
jgi:amidase